MTAEELKQLADLSDEVIKLKAKIIKIRSELLASSLFAENEADESQPSCLGAVSGRSELLIALQNIEKICDNQNPTHEEIWRIAYEAINSH